MLVWGGADGSSYLNTGGRYNPASNTWTGISTGGAPSGRAYHTAVWTGSEMLVWGGARAGVPAVNTGGNYAPASYAWTAISTAGAPSGRRYHTAVWTGSEMLVWGGSPVTNTGGGYKWTLLYWYLKQ